MDKIWYRNPSKSEVIGHCVGDAKTEWPRRTDKSRKKLEKHTYFCNNDRVHKEKYTRWGSKARHVGFNTLS